MAESSFYTYFPSPLGDLLLTSNGRELTGLHLPARQRGPEHRPEGKRDAAPFREACRQLQAYFACKLQEFDLPLSLPGTAFQRRVWRELRRIPFGETISYGEQARRIGRAGASRAVGAANGRNPIPIIVPCHRVIGANGTLTGYGGGLDRKKWLLRHESGSTK